MSALRTCGMIVSLSVCLGLARVRPSSAATVPFAIHGTTYTDYLEEGGFKGALATTYAAGPWVWSTFNAPPLPGWDANSRFEYSFVVGQGVDEGNLVYSQSIVSKNKISARDAQGMVLGTLTLDGAGRIYADLSADRAFVDPVGGGILYRVGGLGGKPGPTETLTVTGATGIYEGLVDIGQQWTLSISGYSVKDLVPGQDAQTIIFTQPLHTFFSEFTISNVPEPGAAGIGVAGVVLGVLARRRRRM